METHDQDPTTESGRDPWTSFHDELGDLGERLRETYRKVSDGTGPTEEDIEHALATLAGVWNQVAGSFTTAFQDPEVRRRVKTVAGHLVSALGVTISELASELQDGGDSSGEEE